MDNLKQSSAAQPLQFLLVSGTDHVAPLTGATPTVVLSKNGGTFAAPAGAVSEVGNGVYKVAGNATDTNTLGPLWLHATATGADPTDREYAVVAYDPQATSLGLVLAKTTNITGFNDVGGTAQTGDSFARIGATGTGLTSLAPSATALTNATWTDAKAAFLNANIDSRMGSYTQPVGFLAATFPASVGTSTYAGADTAGTGTLLSRLTSTRAGLLDNLDATVSSRMATFAVPASFSGADFTRLDVAVSTRSTFAGGAVASVTAPVTVGTNNDKTGYSGTATNFVAAPTASDVATAVWSAGARSLTTFGSLVADLAAAVWSAGTRTLSAFSFTPNVGNVTGTLPTVTLAAGQNIAANNLPTDYQQRGQVVTLPTLPPVVLATVQPNYAPAKASDVQVTVSGTGLSTNAVLALNAAAAPGNGILFFSTYVPNASPIIPVPAPSSDANACVVFGALEKGNNTPASARTLKFTPNPSGVLGAGRLLTFDATTATTLTDGTFTATLVTGVPYRVECADLFQGPRYFTTAGASLDVTPLIKSPQ